MPRLTVEHVARIEGHGNITVNVEDGVVSEVRMDIVEPARFFESMVVGRRFDEAPLITSRICGICSPNHVVTSIKAIEAALGVDVSERTVMLRKLLVYGSYLQNHATHLYILAAPDYVGLPSVFPLAETMPDVVARALRLKKLGNDLTTLVGGRPVHPVTAVIGGFTHEPEAAELVEYRDLLLGSSTTRSPPSNSSPRLRSRISRPPARCSRCGPTTTTRSMTATRSRSMPAGGVRATSTARSSKRGSSVTATRSTPRWTDARSWWARWRGRTSTRTC